MLNIHCTHRAAHISLMLLQLDGYGLHRLRHVRRLEIGLRPQECTPAAHASLPSETLQVATSSYLAAQASRSALHHMVGEMVAGPALLW